MQKNPQNPLQPQSGALAARTTLNGQSDKKPFYAMKRPAKQVNFEEPKKTSNGQALVQLANAIPEERNDVSTEKTRSKAKPQHTSTRKLDQYRSEAVHGSVSHDKSVKRFVSRKDLSTDPVDLLKPKSKKTPDKNFNLFSSKPSSSKFEPIELIAKKTLRDKSLPDKSKTPNKLASNEKPKNWIPRPYPYPESSSIYAPVQQNGPAKKSDEQERLQSKPFMHGVFRDLSKSKERRGDIDLPSKESNHSPIHAKPVSAPIKSALKKKDTSETPKDISESVDNPQNQSKLETVSQVTPKSEIAKQVTPKPEGANQATPKLQSAIETTPSSKPDKRVNIGSLKNIRGPSYDHGLGSGKSLAKKKPSISPSPLKESKSNLMSKSNSSKSLTRKSMSPDHLKKKVHERSEIAQNSFKMNLQDLINIDEIFIAIIYKSNQSQPANNFDLLRHYIVNNYCFILKDLNLLFYNEKFREVMRLNFLKELLYFVFMYIILYQNHLELLAIQRKMGVSANGPGTKSGKGSDRMSIRGYISSVNKETEELILQVLSYIHIVFIIRTEIFMDRAAVYYQNHKTYRELQMLLSKRKSKYNINSSKKENYDHFVQKINRYLDLCEQALHELFKLNPTFGEISGVLAGALTYIASRTGELTIKDYNALFARFKILFDSKGLVEFDLSPILSQFSNEHGTYDEERVHDVEVPTVPFLKFPRAANKLLTLVIDLDETLIHYPDEHLEDLDKKVELENFKIRPQCTIFLEQLSLYYELVIFTAASQNYADLIIDHIDPKGLISYRLYRQHLSVHNNKLIKDLSKIGRDLRTVIILDNMPENFILQPDNGIYIKSWRGEENDMCLSWLQPVLVAVANMEKSDVRDLIQELKKLLEESIK
jgi:Dullard-like phosphatase family protein